uniref:calcium-binding protein n=1 Tax=Polynucleobacter sp. TaxID=2029855 RepID=UPI00404797E5
GTDTIVLRAGDGGATIADADVVTDFTDGTDVFGLAGSLGYSDLVIAQGNGTDTSTANTLVKVEATNEYLTVLQNTSASSVTYLDFTGLSTDPQTLTGDSSSNVLIGASGADTLTGGGGSDVLLGWSGNDTITVAGNGGAAFTTVVDGGAGTDRLNINYSGISSLSDLAPVGYSSGVLTFTDVNGGSITASNIESLYVNDKEYVLYLGVGTFPRDAIWGVADKTLYGLPSSNFSGIDSLSNLSGFNLAADNFSFIGSSDTDSLNLNINRASFSGTLNVSTGQGNDSIYSAKLVNGDSIDLGAGDDTIYVMATNVNSLSLAKLEGGSGTDTLAFEESTNNGTLSLTTGGASGFENLRGSLSAETITGDAQANVIKGIDGVDTIYGLGGNDTLYAGDSGFSALSASSDNTADVLYGGTGNDILVGSAGSNTLDGGTGADTIVTGAGTDTIVLRAGDGGATIADADVVTDFTDGMDVFGMEGGLQFTDITITQGTGSYAADSIIQVHSTGEYLALLTAISATTLTDADFE